MSKTVDYRVKFRKIRHVIKNTVFGKNIFQIFFRVYLFVIMLGAVLLYTNLTHKSWDIPNTISLGTHKYTFWNALFIACSAFTNTGLTCFNISDFYNFWGQFIIFTLIWLGGIGIISLFYVFWNLFRKSDNLKLNHIILLQSERGTTKLNDTFRSIRFSIVFIMCIQIFFGFIFSLWLYWMPVHYQDFDYIGETNIKISYDVSEYINAHGNYSVAIWQGMFCSFTSMNNAGFDIFEQNISIAAFRNDWNIIFQLITIIEIIIGGIGYPLMFDIYEKIRLKRLNITHRFTLFSKVCLISYFAILIIGLIFAYGFEFGAPNTSSIWSESMYWPNGVSITGIHNDDIINHKYWGNHELLNKCWAIFYNTVSTRSAGITTIDQGLFTMGTQIIYILMMFIGGSPSSTAGGIRTTTFVVLLAAIISAVRGRSNTSIFKRNIPRITVIKSFLIFFFGVLLISISTLVIMYTRTVESPNVGISEYSNFDYLSCLYEVASAFGTVGFTMGITAVASPFGLFILVLCMFVGQLGVSNTLLLWVKKIPFSRDINYVEEDIRIG